jgi:glycosyltransferase involved in cell wall biosynthesis
MATWTGVGRYTGGLARALARRDDLEVVQLVSKGSEPPVTIADGADFVVAQSPAFSFSGMREFARVAFASGCDLTHALHFPTPFPAPHPLVVTVHDLSPLLVEGVMPSAPRRAVYRALTARATRVADAIACDSSCTRDDVERAFPAARGKTRVILLAADDFSAGESATLPEDLERLTHAPYMLSMGSTRAHKDLPTLLAAFAELAAQDPELRLLLVGAEDDAFLDAHLAGQPSGIRERVAFTGRVDDAELRTLFARARAFAFPSRYEGFGLPPLEAMSLGTPTVVSDAASLPEVVGDGALVFAAGDAIALAEALRGLLGDEELRARMREAGRARARELTWDKTAEQTVALYREVLAR